DGAGGERSHAGCLDHRHRAGKGDGHPRRAPSREACERCSFGGKPDSHRASARADASRPTPGRGERWTSAGIAAPGGWHVRCCWATRMLAPETFRHLGGGRKGLFIVLRYVFIVAASYLLIFQRPGDAVGPGPAIMIAVALTSNVALS